MITPTPSLCEGFRPREALSGNGLFLLGAPFEGTACFRKGQALGPKALREAFVAIETYSPYLGLDTNDRNDLFDLGDISFEAGYEETLDFGEGFLAGHNLKKENIRLITLGGEHSVTLLPLKKYLKDFHNLLLLHLDAHADLRDNYGGFTYSHASVMRRALDLFDSGHGLLQYGIRSGTREEFALMEKRGTLVPRNDLIRRLAREKGRPIYLTLDLDFFDPGLVPGVGTPEPGGEGLPLFVDLMKELQGHYFVGADIVELAPDLDPTGNSSIFGTLVLREMILAMGGA